MDGPVKGGVGLLKEEAKNLDNSSFGGKFSRDYKKKGTPPTQEDRNKGKGTKNRPFEKK